VNQSVFQTLVLFGIFGALAGIIAFLFRALVTAKEQRINELVAERDYYRSAALIERELPAEPHPAALALGTPTAIVVRANGSSESSSEPGKFAYYSLAIQAGISVIVLIGSFILLIAPVEAYINTLAGNLIIFVVGVWLGRGVDFVQNRLVTR